jgi:hypothetical protein
MRALRLLGFYLVAVVVLGNFSFIGWLWSDWVLYNAPFWPAYALETWPISMVITAAFLAVVCLPLQLFAGRSCAYLAIVMGTLSGPLFVWLLLILSGEPLSLHNYLTASGVVPMHLLFAAIGLLFALGFRVYGPNKSFKPIPCRGGGRVRALR